MKSTHPLPAPSLADPTALNRAMLSCAKDVGAIGAVVFTIFTLIGIYLAYEGLIDAAWVGFWRATFVMVTFGGSFWGPTMFLSLATLCFAWSCCVLVHTVGARPWWLWGVSVLATLVYYGCLACLLLLCHEAQTVPKFHALLAMVFGGIGLLSPIIGVLHLIPGDHHKGRP